MFFGGKTLNYVISARKCLGFRRRPFFWRLPVFGQKICDFGQKKPWDFDENLCPPDLNFAPPPISQSWRCHCHGLQEGRRLQRAHELERGPIEMTLRNQHVKPEDLFFWRTPNFDRKNR